MVKVLSAGRSRRIAAAFVVFVVGVAVAGSAAQADPFSTMGYDVESAMLANSNTSFGTSIGVLYTNPALLTGVKNQIGINFIFNIPILSVKLKSTPPGSSVPISLYDSTAGIVKKSDDIALPTEELMNPRGNTNVNALDPYATIGVAYNFGVKRLQVAVLAELPISLNSAVISTHYNDEREANFSNRIYLTRFGQWDKIAGVMVGAAYQPVDWFSFGLTLQLTVATTMKLKLYIPDANVQSYSQSNTDAEIKGSFRPIIGVNFKPLPWLGIGLVWRNESYIAIDGAGQILLWNYHEQDQNKTIPKRPVQSFKMALNYEPQEATLGIGVNFKPFTTQVSVTWQDWSQYLDSHATHPQFYNDPKILGSAANAYLGQYRFNDTFNVAWSGQWQFKPWGQLALGATYQPTPVPAQTGRTNFADSDLLGVTAGLKFDVEFHNKTSLTMGLDLQVWQMFERVIWKNASRVVDEFPDDSKTSMSGQEMPEAKGLQSNNPGYPGYTVGGTMVQVGASITYNF
ncbi:MAG: hypothetical protein WC889_06340 [Myxococcota bacterium]|jgi:long-subunit fatty acid transport protein